MSLGDQLRKHLTELSPSREPDTVSPSEFNEIELTDDEQKEALRRARELKYFADEKAKYWDKIVSGERYQRPNARELFEKLKQTRSPLGIPFEVTDWNKQVIFSLCLYFAGDPKCETQYEMSLKKGIMIEGPQGTGKTHLMNAFAINPHSSYRNITTKQIAEQYAQKWERDYMDALRYYSLSHKASTDLRDVYGQEVFGFCYGDLGSESVRKQYGNETNVMEHIIFQRYENMIPFNQTHFTTNLTSDELEQVYGVRVRDRLREMCNLLTLNGPSWRK